MSDDLPIRPRTPTEPIIKPKKKKKPIGKRLTSEPIRKGAKVKGDADAE